MKKKTKLKLKHKGAVTAQKIVLIVVGVSTTAIIMMSIKGAIDDAYARALQTALEN